MQRIICFPGGPYALETKYCTADILPVADREDCGYDGIQHYECVHQRNCCYHSADNGPWCFKPNRKENMTCIYNTDLKPIISKYYFTQCFLSLNILKTY